MVNNNPTPTRVVRCTLISIIILTTLIAEVAGWTSPNVEHQVANNIFDVLTVLAVFTCIAAPSLLLFEQFHHPRERVRNAILASRALGLTFAAVCLAGAGYFYHYYPAEGATNGDALVHSTLGLLTLICVIIAVQQVALVIASRDLEEQAKTSST